jgi:hypothetical protein
VNPTAPRQFNPKHVLIPIQSETKFDLISDHIPYTPNTKQELDRLYTIEVTAIDFQDVYSETAVVRISKVPLKPRTLNPRTWLQIKL